MLNPFKSLNVQPRYGLLTSLFFGILLVLFIAPASAHFLLNLNVRIFHVDHLSDGLRVYLRIPMPYLVADKLGEPIGDELPEPAPFTTNAHEDGQIVHYVDPAQLASDPLGLGSIAEGSLLIAHEGQRLTGTVEAVTLYEVGTEPGFATLAEARAVFAAGTSLESLPNPLYVGDTVVDLQIRYFANGPVQTYTISSTLDPGLREQEKTANLILDYGPGDPKVYRSRGLLIEPVEVTLSAFTAIKTFIWEGIRHILEGIDHVLFVICLVLGAAALRSLLWRVTGFTIGHSVTLALGFFGFVPSGAWFVPAVETGIALSIILAAVIAIRSRHAAQDAGVQIFVVTVLIGLLHGLGFSFVLQEILQVSSPNIWQSLLAFNVGVELGQLVIVLAIWPGFLILRKLSEVLWFGARNTIALGCIAIAIVWTVERLNQVGFALAS